MKSSFTKQLKELLEIVPALERPIQNILEDIYNTEHPHYDHYEALRQALEKKPSSLPSHPTADPKQEIERWIETCRSIKAPQLHLEAEFVSSKLRRVVSWSSFSRYHISGSGISRISQRASKIVAQSFKDKLENLGESKQVSVSPKRFFGSTSSETSPTWWSWWENNISSLCDGEKLCDQLALDQSVIDDAKTHKAVVEVTMPYEAVKRQKGWQGLFRTTGLDDFREATLFAPNPSEERFGRTKPLSSTGVGTHSASPGRPEAVSRCIHYQDLPDDLQIEINLIPYKA